MAVWMCLLAACQQRAPGHKSNGSAEQDLMAKPEVVKQWLDLGIPEAGLVKVLPESDVHGFYADYAGNDRNALMADLTRGFERAGYSQSCTALDGAVVGFSNGRRQLAVKIDLLPERALSVFDADGKEPLLHGLCFGRYRAGEAHILTQAEKEALARELAKGDREEDTLSRPGHR